MKLKCKFCEFSFYTENINEAMEASRHLMLNHPRELGEANLKMILSLFDIEEYNKNES